MDVLTGKLSEIPLVEVRGDIDHSTCGDVACAFDEALAEGDRRVLLDLSEVFYVDSGGLSVLFSVARQLRPDGWLGVINPNAHLLRLLELVGLLIDPGFRVFDDRAAAEEACAA